MDITLTVNSQTHVAFSLDVETENARESLMLTCSDWAAATWHASVQQTQAQNNCHRHRLIYLSNLNTQGSLMTDQSVSQPRQVILVITVCPVKIVGLCKDTLCAEATFLSYFVGFATEGATHLGLLFKKWFTLTFENLFLVLTARIHF